MPKKFSYQQLFTFSNNIFLKMGCPLEEAETAAKSLLIADLRGVDSHGVARLTGYVRLWEVKRVNAIPAIKIIHET
ncbi:MAG: Ldh family oxidoreductase, partial [Chitinophagaceae bacterium]